MKNLVMKLFAVLVCAWSMSSFGANEVALLKVQSLNTGVDKRAHFEVLVKNIAYQKNVFLHVRRNGVWSNFALNYNRVADPGRELWSGDFTPDFLSTAANLEFVVGYTVNGVTYWDNNQGANYIISKNGGTILPSVKVYNGNYQQFAGGPTVSGYVTVKNLAFAKDVKVFYTTDGWATTQTANASYQSNFWTLWSGATVPNPNTYGFEEWSFTLNTGFGPKLLEYAIRYVVAGQTYWDNNFGHNYQTTVF